jgi:membrane protease YdiL (CAAX protease family)
VGGLSSSLLLRLTLAGASADSSVVAGLTFALALLVLSVAAGWRPTAIGWRQALIGVAGGAVLCFPPAIRFMSGVPFNVAAGWRSYPGWALAVAVVAAAEEVLFRGALYALVREIGGDLAAIVAGALLFAAMHVVLNGGHAFVLDACVGVWLGVLRMISGGVAAPAAAHVLADLAAWWLR